MRCLTFCFVSLVPSFISIIILIFFLTHYLAHYLFTSMLYSLVFAYPLTIVLDSQVLQNFVRIHLLSLFHFVEWTLDHDVVRLFISFNALLVKICVVWCYNGFTSSFFLSIDLEYPNPMLPFTFSICVYLLRRCFSCR